MAVLDSCPKHNMVTYLEKSEGNVEFHEIIDFLTRTSIHHALTVSPIVSTTFVEQFWTSAKSKTINNVRHITAKVAGKSVSISKASIRSDLLFDDADGIDTLPNQDIFDAIQRMGYEGINGVKLYKALFYTQWRHLDAKKKFVMYPRFISIFLGKQLVDVSVPLDHFPVNTLTSKVFSFMVKKGKHFSGNITPLFATMLVQPTQDEGASSERPSEAQPTPSPAPTSEVPYEPQTDSSPAQTSEVPIEHQPNPSPRPSPTNTIPASIPETSGENLGGHSSSDKSLSGNEGDMTIQVLSMIFVLLFEKQQRFPRKSFSKKHRVHKESVSKQGRKFAKGESSVQRNPLFDEMPEDTIDHMETENAQDEGRTREIVDEDKEIDEVRLSTEDEVSTVKEGVSTDLEKVSTDRPIVSTDGSKVSTDMQIEVREGTEEKVESTDGQVKRNWKHQSAEEIVTQNIHFKHHFMIFGDDDEYNTKVLLNMSKQSFSKEKEKGIDPQDKGNKKIEEEDEFESESDGISQTEKKFKQSLSVMKSVFEEVQSFCMKSDLRWSDEDFISIGSAEDEKLIKRMNEKGVGLSKSEVIKEESKEEVQKEDKDEESTRKRKLGTRKKMKSRKRRYIQYTSEDDSDKENDELRLYLTVAQDKEKEVDYEILTEISNQRVDEECLGAKPHKLFKLKHLEEITLKCGA
ncbi:hypothetical protein Tco_0909482 [Tanacetum coccineum]|uniref:Uncharacterized protein n=1 Tax=Tanacetum coccineum TaxID=301880 RepID=A0ABQ5CSX0_9ASTR